MHSNRLIYTLPEYQKKLRNNYKKLGLFLQNNETHKIFIFRPVPNTPWLPEARKKYFKRLKGRLNSIPNNKKYTMATLTYSGRFYSPDSAAASLKKHLDLFFKRLSYHHRKLEYFYVVELTDNLMVHVHIVFNAYLPWQKLRASWWKVSGNTVTHIMHKGQRDAFYYCIKYLNDSQKQGPTKWNFLFKHVDRLWTCSRGFMATAVSKSGKYKFLFSLWDPRKVTALDFTNPDNDLMSNEVDVNDAIIIAGFVDRFQGCRIMHSAPDWFFYTPSVCGILNKKSIAVTPESFQILFDYYSKQ